MESRTKTKKQSAKKLKDLKESKDTYQLLVEKLSQREQQLSIIIDNIPGLVSQVDNNLRYLYASKGYERLFGIPPEKVVGRTMKEILGETVFKRVEPYVKRALSGEKVTFENPIKMPNGEISYNLVTYIPYAYPYGNIKGFIIVVIDITERKLIEKSFEEEANRRRILMEQSRDGIFILDQNGKVYEANRKFADMLGYSFEEVHQLHVWEWDVQWSPEQLLQKILRVDASGEQFETIYRRKDGTLCDVEISINGAEIKGQKLVFCVCRDISQHKAYEKALRESKECLHVLLSNLPGMVYRCKNAPGWPMEFISEGCFELTGYKPDEFIGENAIPYEHIIHPDDRKSVYEKVQESVKSSKRFNLEYRIFTKQGEEKYVWEQGQLVSPIDSKEQILEGFIMDITARKQAEKHLYMERTYFEYLFNNVPIAIVIGDDKGRISLINNEFSKLFGYTQEEAVGRSIDELIVPDHLLHEAVTLTECAGNGKIVEIETRRKNKDGKEFDVLLRCQPVFIDNKIIGVYGIYHDITERKKAEVEINNRIKELEDFYEMAVGRELRMIELKEQMEELQEQLSKYKKYQNN